MDGESPIDGPVREQLETIHEHVGDDEFREIVELLAELTVSRDKILSKYSGDPEVESLHLPTILEKIQEVTDPDRSGSLATTDALTQILQQHYNLSQGRDSGIQGSKRGPDPLWEKLLQNLQRAAAEGDAEELPAEHVESTAVQFLREEDPSKPTFEKAVQKFNTEARDIEWDGDDLERWRKKAGVEFRY